MTGVPGPAKEQMCDQIIIIPSDNVIIKEFIKISGTQMCKH